MKKLRVVSFQNPYPPNYGGVIDVYYKLKALKDCGYDITLHTFCYGDRSTRDNELRDIVSEVKTYPRHTGLISQFSIKPYIVWSRRNEQLLADLCEDDVPILFEGLHSCLYLGHEKLKDRVKIVRTHNIEHDYYTGLMKSATNVMKKAFFAIESQRLKWFEEALVNADCIAAISESDANYLGLKFGKDKVVVVPPFFDDSIPQQEARKPFVLYGASLNVEENIKAAQWIIENVAPKAPDVEFVLAGRGPDPKTIKMAQEMPNVVLEANPTQERMRELENTAQANVLVTFQPTGVKLKLLTALVRGGWVVANSDMVAGTCLGDYCDVADDPEIIADILKRKMAEPVPYPKPFPHEYTTKHGANILDARIQQLTSAISS